MKAIPFAALPVLLAPLLFGAGCSAFREPTVQPFKAVYAPIPPAFLTGPIAQALTNSPGFSAVVEELGAAPNPEKRLTGTLMAQGARFLFAPDPVEGGKQAREEAFTFIWDVSRGSGFLISEALQGYAPVTISSSGGARFGTNAPAASQNSAADLKITPGSQGVPSRVSAGGIVLNLTRVKIQPPPADLFEPPRGYTKFQSGEIMAEEIALRRRFLKTGRD